MKYIIFDMDGVLIDSEPVTMKAASDALTKYGVEHTMDDFKEFIGAGEDKFITCLSERKGKSEVIDAAMKEMYSLIEERAEKELFVYPSSLKLLKKLKERGYTLALASSSAINKLKVSLKAANIPENTFDVILSGSDVTKKKPDPEMYLKAMERLNAKPSECIVIEDAVNGVKSAVSAGITCFAVTTSFDRETLKAAGASFIKDDIIELLDVLDVLDNENNNSAYNAILKRRSIRKFEQTPIPYEKLERLADCGRLSAFGANMQPLKFGIITDKNILSEIFPCTKWAAYLENGTPKEDERPVAYIAILGDTSIKSNGNFDCDSGLASSTIMIAAQEMGYGSCMLGALNRDEIHRILSLPENLCVVHLIALGVPKQESRTVTMRDSNVKYYLDENGVVNVPKRSLDEVILKF